MVIEVVQSFFSYMFFAWLLLLLGDFPSAFCYHVPEHVFSKLHLQSLDGCNLCVKF
jgi:hypothetical protein